MTQAYAHDQWSHRRLVQRQAVVRFRL